MSAEDVVYQQMYLHVLLDMELDQINSATIYQHLLMVHVTAVEKRLQ